LLSAIYVILMLCLLVLIHELGHFIAAKKYGVYCHEFAIGMGPKLLRFMGKETLYSVRLFPIGGYVRMAGEEEKALLEQENFYIETDKDTGHIKTFHKKTELNLRVIHIAEVDQKKQVVKTGDGENINYQTNALVYLEKDKYFSLQPYNKLFQAKALWQRSIIILAGPLANVILAFFLLMISGFTNGVSSSSATIGEIKGGQGSTILQVNDTILQVEGREIAKWSDFIESIENNIHSEAISIIVLRNETELTLSLTAANLKEMSFIPSKTREIAPVTKYSIIQMTRFTDMIYTSLKRLLVGEESIKNLSGPIGIIKTSYDISEKQADVYILWMAMLSINLAIFNMLPFPALDGGRLSFIIFELIFRKPLDSRREGLVHLAGFIVLIFFTIVITWQDIIRIF